MTTVFFTLVPFSVCGTRAWERGSGHATHTEGSGLCHGWEPQQKGTLGGLQAPWMWLRGPVEAPTRLEPRRRWPRL